MPHTTGGRKMYVCACAHMFMCSQHKHIDIYRGLLSNIYLPSLKKIRKYTFNGKTVKIYSDDANVI